MRSESTSTPKRYRADEPLPRVFLCRTCHTSDTQARSSIRLPIWQSSLFASVLNVRTRVQGAGLYVNRVTGMHSVRYVPVLANCEAARGDLYTS
jgi:hypothetical protein